METSDLLSRPWAEIQTQISQLSEDAVLLLVERPDFDSDKLGLLIDRFPTNRRLLSVLLAHPLLTDQLLEDHLLKASAEHLEWVLPYLEALERPPSLIRATSGNVAVEAAPTAETVELSANEIEQLEAALAQLESSGEQLPEQPAEALEQAEPGAEPGALVRYQGRSSTELAPTGGAKDSDRSAGGIVPSESRGPKAQRRYKASILARLAKMTVGQKVALALKGNGYERLLLVRDHNRLVAATVLKSPKLTERDVQLYSQFNVAEEVLRRIGHHRDWTRHYAVCLNLIKNPRTPQATSMNLIHRLTNVDLRALQINRDVPELVRRSARRVLALRNQAERTGSGSRFS